MFVRMDEGPHIGLTWLRDVQKARKCAAPALRFKYKYMYSCKLPDVVTYIFMPISV